MTVDLNTCFGCNACVVACQAENNVPVVGKEQVRKNRDMAWIRIDRYFAGEPEDPEMLAQAVMCQHCENAPCETVCPVNATVHSEDGLNLMAYNRCIGTRYCANNCPWKVRRFNYFDYNQRPLEQLYAGPLAKERHGRQPQDVEEPERYRPHARGDGKMHLLHSADRGGEDRTTWSRQARGTRYEVPISEFKTACQQACPSDSLVFGNIKDRESRVSRSAPSRSGLRDVEILEHRAPGKLSGPHQESEPEDARCRQGRHGQRSSPMVTAELPKAITPGGASENGGKSLMRARQETSECYSGSPSGLTNAAHGFCHPQSGDLSHA